MKGKTIAELVLLAKQNIQPAKEELCRRTYNLGYFTAFKMVKNSEDAQDILHDTYVTLFTKLDQLQENEKFIAWFKVSVSNKTKDYLKKKKPILFTEMENDDFSEGVDFEDEDLTFRPDEMLDLNETQRLIENMLDDLPEEQRMCTLMYYYDQLSVNEIAETLGISTGTVKSRLNYARQKIKANVLTLESKGTKLYSTAIIPLFVYFLQQAGKKEQLSQQVLEKILSNLETPSQLPVNKNSSISAKEMLAKLTPSKLVAGITAAVVTITASAGIYAVQKNQNINSAEELKNTTIVTSGDSQRENAYLLNSSENTLSTLDTVQTNLLESVNNIVSNISVAENDEGYIYEDILGFLIPFPVEWQGKYTLVEKENAVGVYYNDDTEANSVISIAPTVKFNSFTKYYYSDGAPEIPEEEALPIVEETLNGSEAVRFKVEINYYAVESPETPDPLEETLSLTSPETPDPLEETLSLTSPKTPDPREETLSLTSPKTPDRREETLSLTSPETPDPREETLSLTSPKTPDPVLPTEEEKQPPTEKNSNETKQTIFNTVENEKLIFTFYLKEVPKNFIFPVVSKLQLYKVLGLDESNQLILGFDDKNFIYVSWQGMDTSSPQDVPDDFYEMKEYPVKSEKWKLYSPYTKTW